MIGALAMAAHRYSRATHDIDLGTAADIFTTLKRVGERLQAEGFEIETNLPDQDDPLGGVINVIGEDFDTVQIVNFFNPWTGVPPFAKEAIELAESAQMPGSALRVVDLPHLVALKLYAGGSKSRDDVSQLLAANPDADLAAVRKVSQLAGVEADLDAIFEG